MGRNTRAANDNETPNRRRNNTDGNPTVQNQGRFMSIRDILALFCCPPCPSSIASKLAFWPPNPPSYSLQPLTDNSNAYQLVLSEEFSGALFDADLDNVEFFYTQTRRRNTIACMYIRVPNSRYTVLYSHGNAVDLGQMVAFYKHLSARLRCSLFAYDYSGYGSSNGRPSEKNLYADIDAAFQACKRKYNLCPEQLILYGQSIGTVPTVEYAAHHQCAAVVLHSPLLSGLKVACPTSQRNWACDPFAKLAFLPGFHLRLRKATLLPTLLPDSINKVHKIKATVLVIHGTEDDVVDFSHGLAIWERCPATTEPLWLEGAGHNDVEQHFQYIDRLHRFVHDELPRASLHRAIGTSSAGC